MMFRKLVRLATRSLARNCSNTRRLVTLAIGRKRLKSVPLVPLSNIKQGVKMGMRMHGTHGKKMGSSAVYRAGPHAIRNGKINPVTTSIYGQYGTPVAFLFEKKRTLITEPIGLNNGDDFNLKDDLTVAAGSYITSIETSFTRASEADPYVLTGLQVTWNDNTQSKVIGTLVHGDGYKNSSWSKGFSGVISATGQLINNFALVTPNGGNTGWMTPYAPANVPKAFNFVETDPTMRMTNIIGEASGGVIQQIQFVYDSANVY